jgi:hypothetical protein
MTANDNRWLPLVIAVGLAGVVSQLIERTTGRDPFWALILLLALGWVVLRIGVPWARSRLGPPAPRVRILRALRAEGAGLPHYFLETARDDGRRSVTHLSGLWLFAYERSRTDCGRFPCREVQVDALRPAAWMSDARSTRMLCVGEPFEPLHAAREVTADAAARGYLGRDWEPLGVGYEELCDYFGAADAAQGEPASPERPETPVLDAEPVVPGGDAGDAAHEDVTPAPAVVVAAQGGTDDGPTPGETAPGRTPPGRLVPVRRYVAVRALRVEEKGRRGPHYFVLLDDGTVLHLNGRYLRAYEPGDGRPRVFPCTSFEPTEGRSNLDCSGEPLEPDVARRPVGPEDRGAGFLTENWMLLDRRYEEVLEHFGTVAAAPTRPVAPAGPASPAGPRPSGSSD